VSTVTITAAGGGEAGTVELPAAVFDVDVNIPLVHQVVVGQLAAARQGTADTKNRGEVRGGGRKPYRQKGTGRARQGSTRAPQFAGGGTVHGPTPRSYAQRTPKKMKAAALRCALSDRARAGRVHVVESLVSGEAPSTRTALTALDRIATSRHVLVVVERADTLTYKSLRNVASVHLLAADQLNTYDVLVSDDVVFTAAALQTFLAQPSVAGAPTREPSATAEPAAPAAPAEPAAAEPAAPKPRRTRATKAAVAKEETVTEQTPEETEPATSAGTTTPAGEGVPDDELAEEVAEQTSSDLAVEPLFTREAEGTTTDTEAAKADADEVGDDK
jgi:large subunit ribosomal protein L4